MNNVWTTIAFRAPCVARQPIARKPILQLFNGYARSHTSAFKHSRLRLKNDEPSSVWRAGFATTAIFQKKRARPGVKRKDIPNTLSRSENPSKLEAAPTVASHTEGLLEEPEALTWRDYDPTGGMPLPGGELAQPQINGIFGNEDLDAETGNYVLSVLYWRRLSGALIDSGIDFPSSSGVHREQAIRGLEYVRSLDPGFDEQAAGRVWAEEESLRLQQELQDRAIKLRLYKSDEEPQDTQAVAEESEQGTEYGRERNQDSALMRLREENKARNAAEETKRKADRELADAIALEQHRGPLQLSGGVQPPTTMELPPTGDISITRPQTKAWLAPVERKPWVKYYEQQAQIIKDNTVPQYSLFRRLFPSFLMLIGLLAFCAFLSENYAPPPKSARLWPDTPPSIATLSGITLTLAVFFVAGRMPPLWRTYSKFFTVVPAYPYAVSLLGAQFRHDTLAHLLTNVGALWLFGSILHEDVGRGTFLAIYVASGAIGGYAALTYYVLRGSWASYIFGSSGCVLGVLSASCALHPNGTIKLFGYDVPIAAWVFLALYGFGEMVAVVRIRKTGIDHAGHLGGIIGGLACALWLKMKTGMQTEAATISGEMKRVDVTDGLREVGVATAPAGRRT